MTPPVVAVVVAYRSGTELPACLGSLSGRVNRIVVADNAPERSAPPALREKHPEVIWIDNDSNRGFAGAVNQGVAASTEPYILLVNPDCELLTGVEALVRACEDQSVAGAGGRLEDRRGAVQKGFFARSLPSPWVLAFEALGVNRAWKRNPFNRHYRLLELDPDRACEVDQPAGAFLLLRREAFRAVGGMDEAFHPVWFEDVDLCKRFRDRGFRLRYVPTAVARHGGAHAVRQMPADARLRAWYGGMLRYSEKHFPRHVHRRVCSAVFLGLAMRQFSCFVRSETRTGADAYEAMLRIVPGIDPHRLRHS